MPAKTKAAPKWPAGKRVRIRMYRQSLGDCFLLLTAEFQRMGVPMADSHHPFIGPVEVGLIFQTKLVIFLIDDCLGSDDIPALFKPVA